jgi:hypothetical protein
MSDTPADTDALTRRFLESEIRLREVTLDVYASLGATARDLSFAINDGASAGPVQGYPPWYTPNTNTGELLPVYRSEAELTAIRDRSRIMSAYNEFALCAVENRVNYVVGDGLKYAAAPRDPHNAAHRASAKAAQEIIDEWCEVNDSAALEAETLSRLDTEGEAFLRVFTAKGTQHVRFVEPEHVKAPVSDSTDRANSFGVITDPDDVATVEGYWIVEQPTVKPMPTKVPASKVLHLKLNTRANAKRGLPTLFPVEANLKRCEDLLASMSSMAKARAKIALIRKITGLTSATANTMLDRLAAARVTDPANGQTVNVEQLRYGSILTASGNTDYEMPGLQLGASDIVGVLQAELRAVASRLQMPEWMFTALADAKYSNAFIVEAPTLKAFRRLQRLMRNGFGLCRYGHRMSLMWRQLHAAVDAGRLVSADIDNVNLTCEGPTLEARDRAGEVSRHEKLVAAGFESKETAQRQLELDPDAERPLIAAEQIGRARPVADSTAVSQIQTAFYAGTLPRDAAAANLMILLGFTREQAEALLPASDCVKRVDDGSRDDAPAQPGAPAAPAPAQPGTDPAAAVSALFEQEPQRKEGDKWQGESGAWFELRDGRPVRTAAPNSSGTGTDAPATSAPASTPETDALVDEIAAQVPDAPAGIVAKAKRFAVDLAVKAYSFAARADSAIAKVGGLLEAVFETPRDLDSQFGINPTASSGMDAKGVDPIKSAMESTLGFGVSGHLAISIVSRVAAKAIGAIRKRLSEADATPDTEAAVGAWAEFLANAARDARSQLDITEGAEPDAAAFADAIRAKLAPSEPAREHTEYTEAEAMRLTEADRSKLVKKEITDRNGHKRTVYVRPGTAEGADAHTNTADTPHESPVHAVLRDPSKVTPEQAAAVVAELQAMPKEQLRQLSLAIRERIGGKRAVLVDRLTEYVKKRREAGQPVAPAARPAPTVAPPTAAPTLPKNLKIEATDREASARADALFGEDTAPELLAAASNAADGASVEVYDSLYRPGAISVRTSGDGYSATRYFYRDTATGELRVNNSTFGMEYIKNKGHNPNDPKSNEWMKKNPALNGTELLANQVRALRAIGVKKITTLAARADDIDDPNNAMNGFYTWPRLGYDASIPEREFKKMPPELQAQVGANPTGSKTERSILDLMATTAGRDWWKANGTDIRAEFDLSDGSLSMRTLEKYLNDRAAKGGSE